MQPTPEIYYEKLYVVDKQDNLEAMYEFLERNNHPILNQEDMKYMSRPITIDGIESATTTTRKLPPKISRTR